MRTLFTKIIKGELPGHFVWRDDRCVAFLSIAPLAPGHTLVVPLTEVDHWLEADDDLIAHLMSVAKKIGLALDRAFNPTKVGMMIAGLEIPHLHIHLVPIMDVRDLDFTNADHGVTSERLDADAAEIVTALSELLEG